jgi:hypothetical protein
MGLLSGGTVIQVVTTPPQVPPLGPAHVADDDNHPA